MDEDHSWETDVVSSRVRNGGVADYQLFVVFRVHTVIIHIYNDSITLIKKLKLPVPEKKMRVVQYVIVQVTDTLTYIKERPVSSTLRTKRIVKGTYFGQSKR